MLSQAELDSLRQSLQARAVVLQAEIGAKRLSATGDRADLQGGNDSGDLSVAETDRDIDLAEAERDLGEARQVQAVLARIENGEYGLCADCGIEIATNRLKAQPLAMCCIDCQSKRERRHGDRHSSL